MSERALALATASDASASVGDVTLEDAAISTEHVDGADDETPEAEDGGNLNGTEGTGEASEAREESHEFAREVSKTRKADRGHGANSEDEGQSRELGTKTAKSTQFEGTGGTFYPTTEEEEESDGKAVSQHEQGSTLDSPRVVALESYESGKGKEDVAHVHHGRVTEHQIQTLLVNRDVTDPDHVADEQHEERREPSFKASTEDRLKHEQTIEAELLKDAGVHHGHRSRSRSISRGSP